MHYVCFLYSSQAAAPSHQRSKYFGSFANNVSLCLEYYLVSKSYLYVELRAGDIQLLRGQEPLMTGYVLQDHCEVDQVVSHHVLILGWEDLLLNNLDWKDRGKKEKHLNHDSHNMCQLI